MKKERVRHPEGYVEAFCARVKSSRERAGITNKAQFARDLGVGSDAYATYEGVPRSSLMPHHVIPKFCLLTKTNPLWLLTGDEEQVAVLRIVTTRR